MRGPVTACGREPQEAAQSEQINAIRSVVHRARGRRVGLAMRIQFNASQGLLLHTPMGAAFAGEVYPVALAGFDIESHR